MSSKSTFISTKSTQPSISKLGISLSVWSDSTWSGKFLTRTPISSLEPMELSWSWIKMTIKKTTFDFPNTTGKLFVTIKAAKVSFLRFGSKSYKAYSWVYMQVNENDQNQSSGDLFMTTRDFTNRYYNGASLFNSACQVSSKVNFRRKRFEERWSRTVGNCGGFVEHVSKPLGLLTRQTITQDVLFYLFARQI